jgi:hypothetical protein
MQYKLSMVDGQLFLNDQPIDNNIPAIAFKIRMNAHGAVPNKKAFIDKIKEAYDKLKKDKQPIMFDLF